MLFELRNAVRQRVDLAALPGDKGRQFPACAENYAHQWEDGTEYLGRGFGGHEGG